MGVKIPQIEISEITKKPQNASKAILKMSLLLDENRADFGVKSLDLEDEIFTSSFFWVGNPKIGDFGKEMGNLGWKNRDFGVKNGDFC